jgi:circadian clock protein KaiC
MTPKTIIADSLRKAASGIAGLDEITFGGLPAGRPTLIAGAAGCGKTLFALTFLVKGATAYDEPGVFMSFEERADDLIENVSSLGYDLPGLIADKKLVIDYVRVERSEIEQSGEYDLEVLDTLEALFSGLGDGPVLRAELRRLFQWLKDRGVTAMITAERGPEGQLTRHGLEEYVSDCVIALDNRVDEQITTRRLRVMKYRGSAHGTNEYPFLIDKGGISVLPVTSAGLSHSISDDVVSSGIGGIDAMLGVGGFYRGSSVLLSGPSGTGKTTFGSHFVNAACLAGQRAIYFSFEESPEQIVRNMRSVGLDLGSHVTSGLLRFESSRPSLFGLEMHLVLMIRQIDQFDPAVVVIDPISAFRGSESEIHATLLRLVDYLKVKGITVVFNNLVNGDQADRNEQSLSSLMDVWIGLHDLEANGERNRGLFVLKARGMSHSNQIREYRLGSHGVSLIEPYIGPHGVLTGSARIVQEAQEEAAALERRDEIDRRRREFAEKKNSAERQIAETREALQREEAELLALDTVDERKEQVLTAGRSAAATRRGAAT